MRKQLYWLSDEEWRSIEASLLPRGRRGAHRVDDRRVISGVLYMLRSGARSRDCPPEYGPYTTIYNRFNRWSKQGIWEAIFYKLTDRAACFLGRDRHHSCQGPSFRRRRKRGAFCHAIGRSRGGRTSKIHALTDATGRPRAFGVTAGDTHDLVGAADLLRLVPIPQRLIADRSYDAKKLREWLIERGCEPVIPAQSDP